jgi:hypothetical protein
MKTMLYTIIPLEKIKEGEDNIKGLDEIEIQGVRLQVRMEEKGFVEIVRVIDSNPQTYLHPHFQPGRKVKLIPEL